MIYDIGFYEENIQTEFETDKIFLLSEDIPDQTDWK